MLFREASAASFGFAGAAEVKFLTAGNVEFKADLRDERGSRVKPCPTSAYGANEGLGMPVPSNTGTKQCGQRCAPCDPRPQVCPGNPRGRSKGDVHRQRACYPSRRASWVAPKKAAQHRQVDFAETPILLPVMRNGAGTMHRAH
jgi:hypothetical protein